MNVPDKWSMGPQEKIHKFIDENSFGLIVSNDMQASHLPFYLAKSEGQHGVLYGHFARSNSHWKSLNKQDVLVVFTGPHAYISPTWYVNQPAVPTWNYSAVHVSGTLTLTDDAMTMTVLEQLTEKYEPALNQGQQFIPAKYKQKLAHGVVGFKVDITELQGKEKLGQHRKEEDQNAVYLALGNSQVTAAKSLHAYMKENNVGTGSR